MAGGYIADVWMADRMKNLRPHKNMFDPMKPRQLNRMINMPKPVAATIDSWWRWPAERPPNQEEIAFASQFEC